jgi:MFS family permease
MTVVSEAGTLRYASAKGRWALLATVLGSSVVMLDGTVVNIALPAIGHDLGAGVDGLQWIISGYLLTLASLILLGGSLGDRFGRRRVFVMGVVWFADLVEWLGRVESAVVPGFGAVLGTGDLWQDVALASNGRGSITGALVGLGVPVDTATELEQAVASGQILLVVHGAFDAAAVHSVLAA